MVQRERGRERERERETFVTGFKLLGSYIEQWWRYYAQKNNLLIGIPVYIKFKIYSYFQVIEKLYRIDVRPLYKKQSLNCNTSIY